MARNTVDTDSKVLAAQLGGRCVQKIIFLQSSSRCQEFPFNHVATRSVPLALLELKPKPQIFLLPSHVVAKSFHWMDTSTDGSVAGQNLVPHSCSYCQYLTIDMRKTDAVYERDERLFRSSHLSPSPTTTTVPAARERRDRWPQAHIVADIDYNMTGLVAGSAAGCAFMRWLVEDQGFGAHIPHLIGPRERAKGYRFRLHTYGSSWDVKRIRWLALGTATEVDDILGKNAVQTNVGFGVYTYPGLLLCPLMRWCLQLMR
jgi:hypothetical protein